MAMSNKDGSLGKKPDRDIPADKIGKLELSQAVDASEIEATGRGSTFWLKCWNCDKYLSRPLTPPGYDAYTCPSCGAVNLI
jgi:rRNA maturation endonuclease Nob1